MLARYQDAEKRADWRAYFAGVAPRLEKPPKPSEAFPLLADDSAGGSMRPESLPAHWKVSTGRDTEAVQRMQFLIAGANLRRMAANKQRVQ